MCLVMLAKHEKMTVDIVGHRGLLPHPRLFELDLELSESVHQRLAAPSRHGKWAKGG